ncbi:hypothetical protein SNE40_022457 [Patella caerulea]|uniref:ABC transmembrane type-1 domain-containing protein n=1 Tax=Patella caerulea TaxID=87958 RepID=A0AAN8GFS9_PATCE
MRQKSYELNSNNNAVYTLNASTSKSKTVKPPDELDTGPETIKQDDLEARPENKEKTEVVGFFTLFRFADCLDIFLMLIGCFVAMLHGAAYPALIYVYGDSIDVFISTGIFETFIKSDVVSGFLGTVNLTVESVLKEPPLLKSHCEYLSNLTDGNYTCDAIQPQLTNQLLDQMFTYTIYYIIIGCAVIVLGYLQITVWMTSAERQAHRIRLEFFRNVMRQEIGWFDTNDTGEVNSRLADDINKIHDGLGDKIGSSIQWISAFVAGCIIGFINGWKLTLVILSISPLLILASALMSKLAGSMTNKELKAYAKAGSIAEEVLSSIRTVVMFGGQKLEAER